MKQRTQLDSWKELQHHFTEINASASTLDFLSRKKQCTVQHASITLDYSRQHIMPDTVTYLLNLAHELNLPNKIIALVQGEKINKSENRPALHTALRQNHSHPIWVDGRNIMKDVQASLEQVKHISTRIREKKWLGYTGKPIKDVVNIGIGGSNLGARLCLHALDDYCSVDLGYHFISDVDPECFKKTIAYLDPQTTLFLISSKSFTTKETLINTQKARDWLGESSGWEQHFIAITANLDAAKKMGISTVLPIDDWVGGRYSLCSAVNLITAIAIGYTRFSELLAGAYAMDEHFLHAEFSENMPVLLGLLGIWNTNFWDINNLLFLVYSQKLEYFVPHIQQLDMESNGKSVDNFGHFVNYATGPIVWGGLGNQAQHSYMQLLCQGTHKIAADFITLDVPENAVINQMCEDKIKVLSEGLRPTDQAIHYIPGRMPINHIHLAECSPYSLGALVALYEHKIYVQSVVWNINPFDQPGVECAKHIIGHIRG